MIPPGYASGTPAGERELFDKLRTDPATNGWVVLHSLDIKRHRSKIEGELDMVVVVPGLGVLCIEVKGCSVSRRDGNWVYPYEVSSEGPFKQASKAMHSLRDYVSRKDRSLSNLLYFSAVVFTKADFEEASPEWHPWQYINRKNFARRPISTNVTDILQRAHDHMRSVWGHRSWYDDVRTRPSDQQTLRLVQLLRDEFEYLASPRHDLEKLEIEIRRFTEEQFDALDLLRENDRVVFKGPAGTGKTVLAIEAARRAVSEGLDVLFVCYNRLLGDWLKKETSGIARSNGGVRCGTFHALLLAVTGTTPPAGASSEYWRQTLPVAAADRLLDGTSPVPAYDMLVVDEAQDLMVEDYLDVLDLLLKGGLAGGRWAMFGDFERQAIYALESEIQSDGQVSRLIARAPGHANFPLRINCRNAEPIAQTFSIASGLTPGYKRCLHDMEGADVDPLFYNSPSHQVTRLKDAICDLRKHFRQDEIVVLSMRSDDTCCARLAAESAPELGLVPIRHVRDGVSVPFVSVHAFKGLESSAVIITDVEDLDEQRSQALLYIGMSRARTRLYILMKEACRQSYSRILDAGLKKTSGK
jgi:hypothetical protein